MRAGWPAATHQRTGRPPPRRLGWSSPTKFAATRVAPGSQQTPVIVRRCRNGADRTWIPEIDAVLRDDSAPPN